MQYGPQSMPINGGLFIGLDGMAFIRHVHAALLATNVAARSEPGYERTTRLDPSGRVILQQLEWSLLILVRANWPLSTGGNN